MAKKYKHWCDDKHKKKETHFVLGELAETAYCTLEAYLLCDVSKRLSEEKQAESYNQEQYTVIKAYITSKFKNLLDKAEDVECYLKDANSIFGLYAVDFEHRRIRWLKARGLCFQLIAELRHIAGIVHRKTNIQKYVDVSNMYVDIANRITNIIKADDKRKKENCKEYFAPPKETEEE